MGEGSHLKVELQDVGRGDGNHEFHEGHEWGVGGRDLRFGI